MFPHDHISVRGSFCVVYGIFGGLNSAGNPSGLSTAEGQGARANCTAIAVVDPLRPRLTPTTAGNT
jgi:hypothetical protein